MPEKLMVKNYVAETKAIEGKRRLHVTITTDTPDRDGDIVEPKGIKTANYRRNNAVLFGHDYRGLPIAKGENLVKTEHGITADVIFPEEGIYPLADTVYNMGKHGFIKAWSIGFIPIKTEDIADEDEKNKDTDIMRRKGRRIKSCDLLEFSACAVGCNPDALTNMIAKGIDIEPLKEAGFIEIEEDKEIITKPEETSVIPIEEKVLEAVKEFNPNEIYEIVKENKELKEKVDKLELEKKDLELKVGAVLNKKNKVDLKDAQEKIQSVLDSAEPIEENSLEIEETKDSKGDDKGIDIEDDKKDDKGIDEAKLEEIIEKTFKESNKSMKEHFNKRLDYIMGRIK